jgi:MFS transporter, SHS family, sialic acid transporter
MDSLFALIMLAVTLALYCAVNFGVIGGGVAPFITLSTMNHLSISMSTAIIAFSICAALLGAILLYFTRETKGLNLSEIDNEAV